jgi:hypothetical protein
MLNQNMNWIGLQAIQKEIGINRALAKRILFRSFAEAKNGN